MFNTRILLRMAKWARHPPSKKQMRIVFGVLAVCLALFAYDWAFGWPEFLTTNGTPGGRFN